MWSYNELCERWFLSMLDMKVQGGVCAPKDRHRLKQQFSLYFLYSIMTTLDGSCCILGGSATEMQVFHGETVNETAQLKYPLDFLCFVASCYHPFAKEKNRGNFPLFQKSGCDNNWISVAWKQSSKKRDAEVCWDNDQDCNYLCFHSLDSHGAGERQWLYRWVRCTESENSCFHVG